MLSSQKRHINALFKHNTVSLCITMRLILRAPPSDQPLCSHTHLHVTLTCQCAQNCQPLLKALGAMCNSFNTGRADILIIVGVARSCHPASCKLHKAAGNSFNLSVSTRGRSAAVISGSFVVLSGQTNISLGFLHEEQMEKY